MANIVYALLHIPTGEYVCAKHKNYDTLLCEDTVAANKLLSIMISDTSFFWGYPRKDYTIGKTLLKEFDIPPNIVEFEIVAIPKDILSKEALAHTLLVGSYSKTTYCNLNRNDTYFQSIY